MTWKRQSPGARRRRRHRRERFLMSWREWVEWMAPASGVTRGRLRRSLWLRMPDLCKPLEPGTPPGIAMARLRTKGAGVEGSG